MTHAASTAGFAAQCPSQGEISEGASTAPSDD